MFWRELSHYLVNYSSLGVALVFVISTASRCTRCAIFPRVPATSLLFSGFNFAHPTPSVIPAGGLSLYGGQGQRLPLRLSTAATVTVLQPLLHLASPPNFFIQLFFSGKVFRLQLFHVCKITHQVSNFPFTQRALYWQRSGPVCGEGRHWGCRGEGGHQCQWLVAPDSR